MAHWFEKGYKPEEVDPAEDLKQVVNNPPNNLPFDGEARHIYFFKEWVKNRLNKKRSYDN